MRLIEYGAVYEYAFKGVHGGGLEDEDFNAIINAIDAVPTIDAVPVCRCKNCYKRDKSWCPMYCARLSMRDDDFCSYGEKRCDDAT